MGVPCGEITSLLPYRRVVRRFAGPESMRGLIVKRIFEAAPLRWASFMVRPLQPNVEILCIDPGQGARAPK